MAFSILSKRMLENYDIKKIVDKIKNYASIFTLNQQRSFDLEFDISTKLTLKDFDNVAGNGSIYGVYLKQLQTDFSSNDYWYILPIIRFEEIKDNSQIISEDENTITVQYGSGLTSRVSTSDALQKINMNLMMGDIVETNRKITIFLSKDGKRTQLRVFKNQQTGEEYVFMKKKDDGTFDDSLDIQATFVGVVSPLTWTVDKKTGLAICSNPLFLSEKSGCEYDKSALSKFLESDEFVEELGIHYEKKQEKSTVVNNPFGMIFDKPKPKLSLSNQIRNVLIGGKSIPYLVGHPGIGKSEVAYSINKKLIKIEVSQFTPDDFTGKTSIVPGDKTISQNDNTTIEHHEPGYTTTAEPQWHIKLRKLSQECQDNERCSLVIDEFDKLTPNMQVFINGIVSNPRTIAGWEIPDNVDIILTGNTEEYSDTSFAISGEVASRLTTIEVKADSIDWLKWASKHGIDPIVKAYIHCFPNKIIQDVKDKNGEYDYSKSLTPRSWDQKISNHLIGKRKASQMPRLEIFMDESCERDFEEFMKLYFELGVEEILKGNIPFDVFDLTHDRIQIIINCLIATATTEEEITNALTFIRQNNLSEYQALFEKRWTEINDTDEDILKLKLAKSSLGERSSGYGK